MRFIINILVIILVLTFPAYSQVEISGEINGLLETDFYIVTDSLFVRQGNALIIQPGSTLEFLGDYSFVIYGYLEAEGTPDSIITFQHNSDSTEYWSGIDFRINSDDQSILRYCSISGSHKCAVEAISCNPTISDCEIFDNINTGHRGGGIFCYQGASPTITNCYIHDNYGVLDAGGIYCTDNSNAIISNCLLVNNESDFGGAIYANYCSPVISNCLMIDNISTYYGGGLYLYNSHTVVEKCMIIGNYAENGGGGIHLRNDFSYINKCTIVGNDGNAGGGGIYAWDRGDVEIVNNIIYGNTNGGAHIGSVWSAVINNNNIFGNDEDITGEPPEWFGVLSQTNVNGDSCDAFYNIFADPMFYDYENDDLRLTPPSPCIDAGDENILHDPDGSIIDIGADVYPGYQSDLEFGIDEIQIITYGLETDSAYLAINNDGEGWGIIDSIRFSEDDDSLQIAEDFYQYIEPGGIQIAKMYWTPVSTDTMFNQIQVYHNDENLENPYIIDISGLVVDAVEDENNPAIPTDIVLHQNYPNPFNSTTNISFDLPHSSTVKIDILNVLGQSVKSISNSQYSAGKYSLIVDMQEFTSGIYYCHLSSGTQNQTVKMLYIR